MKNFYTQRVEEFSSQAQQSAAYATRVAIFRLIYFFAAIGLFIFIYSKGILLAVIIGLLLILLFGLMIRYHLKIQAQTQFLESLAFVNQKEINAINRKLDGFPDGEKFLDPLHRYALDLDLFGPYSFFQYYNRCSTELGQQEFANYLLDPAGTQEILDRQQAISELSEDVEWRQKFLALGVQQKDNDKHVRLLNSWLESPDYVKDKIWIPTAFFIAPLFFLLGSYLCIYVIPWPFIIFFLGAPMWLLSRFVVRINETHRQTSKAGEVLSGYATLIKAVEDQTFNCSKLKQLQGKLLHADEKASKVVKKLSYIISQLETRKNAFAIILNIIGLWDLYWVYRLELWKEKYKQDINPWFNAFGEFESLISFSGLKYNQKHWVLPAIIENGDFDAQDLSHPLIDQEEVVGNDLNIPAKAHLKLLTGSNMAGKSTFLRTVGLNIVIGLAGGPVAAKVLTLPQLDVFTSMRTQDVLHESTSSFYAELKRLKMILQAVENHNTSGKGLQPFFLLDEILKGTNSVDRHTGSKALIEQLISEKASGIIATHDLELGTLEKNANGAIENLCIEVAVKDGKLIFDYKIQKGVSKSFNATQLMREMGIKNL